MFNNINKDISRNHRETVRKREEGTHLLQSVWLHHFVVASLRFTTVLQLLVCASGMLTWLLTQSGICPTSSLSIKKMQLSLSSSQNSGPFGNRRRFINNLLFI